MVLNLEIVLYRKELRKVSAPFVLLYEALDREEWWVNYLYLFYVQNQNITFSLNLNHNYSKLGSNIQNR